MHISELAALLQTARFARGTERDLEEAVKEFLEGSGLAVERQVRSAAGRIDLLTNGIALELKVDGSLSGALIQAQRYLSDPRVNAVLIATTCRWRLVAAMPESLSIIRLHALF